MTPVDRAVRAITRCAQNYTEAQTFAQAIRMHTQFLNRNQLLSVIAQQAGLLSCFFGADPLSNQGQQMIEDLDDWLHNEGS